MIIFKLPRSLPLLLFILLSCVACTPRATPTEAVRLLCKEEVSPPAGILYGYRSTDGSIPLLSEEMLCALFGNGSLPAALDEAAAGACYLCPTHPFEITVFYAKSNRGAEKLAAMCLQRKEQITQYWSGKGYDDYIQNAEVTVNGRWVLFSVSKDPSSMVRQFARAT